MGLGLIAGKGPPPNPTPAPVVAWGLWPGGGLGQSSALAIVMLLMMTPAIALYWFFARRPGLLAT